jgi:ankyrin repeat protein
MFRFQFGHLTAGQEACECNDSQIFDKVQNFVDELYEADGEHYQVYFVNPDNSAVTIMQSGLLIYHPNLSSSQELQHLPDSRDSVYEIVIDFLTGNINWWLDRFQTSIELPVGHRALFAAAKRDTVDYPLHKAVVENDLVDVVALIKAGHDVNSLDNKRCTPLVLAANQGHFEICKYLVEHGADIHAKDNWGNTVFRLADDYPKLAAYLNSLKIK